MTERLHFHFHALEKEMATHSSVLAWRIPGTGGPGGLPSLGSHRVGHDLATNPPPHVYQAYVALLLFRGREAARGRDDNGQAVAPTMEGSMCIRVARMALHYLVF